MLGQMFEENLLGRGLLDELDRTEPPEVFRSMEEIWAIEQPSIQLSRNSFCDDTNFQLRDLKMRKFSHDSGFTGSTTSDDRDFETEKMSDQLIQECVNAVKPFRFSPSGRAAILSTPTFELEAKIQCKFKEMQLPDDGTPGPKLLERYQHRCPKALEALRTIRQTIDTFGPTPISPSKLQTFAPPHSSVNSKISVFLHRADYATKEIRQSREKFEDVMYQIFRSFEKTHVGDELPREIIKMEWIHMDAAEVTFRIMEEINAMENIIKQLPKMIRSISWRLIDYVNAVKDQLAVLKKTASVMMEKLKHSVEIQKSVDSVPAFNSNVYDLNKYIEIVNTTFDGFIQQIIVEVEISVEDNSTTDTFRY